MTTTPIAAGPNDVTVRALPCPFCGMNADLDGEDTIYPTGTGWRFNEELQIRTYHRALEVPEEQWCWGMHCPETYGGCGASIHGDSKDEALAKWNTRSNAKVSGVGTASAGLPG